jgi:hypothetical protein
MPYSKCVREFLCLSKVIDKGSETPFLGRFKQTRALMGNEKV